MNSAILLNNQAEKFEAAEHAIVGRHVYHGSDYGFEGDKLVKVVQPFPTEGEDYSEKLTVAFDKFHQLGQFCVKSPDLKPGSDAVVGKRLIAALWVLFPSLFEGKSITTIAKEIGVTPACLAAYTGEFSRAFKVRSHAQSHGAGKFRPADDAAMEGGNDGS